MSGADLYPPATPAAAARAAGPGPASAATDPLALGTWLVQAGHLSPEDAARIHEHQAQTGQPFAEAGLALGLLRHDDVQQALATHFGHWPLQRGVALSRELVAAWQPQSLAVEQLRSLRSQLMLRWFENDVRHAALAIVSPGPDEGRSWMAANLGILFAQLGLRTLLIDADLRQPRLHRLFAVPGRIGLSSVLAARAGTEVIEPVDAVPGLSLLPAGGLPPNPQELLARDRLQRLLASLRSSYDVVLADTPAFTQCADAGTVAVRAGAALLVARRHSSAARDLAALNGTLREFGVTVVGAVLNASP